MARIAIRPAIQRDLCVLWEFLAIAAYEASAGTAMAMPVVALHLAGWPRRDDFGFIAELEGIAVGAAWARQFSPEEEPAFSVDDRSPEISIGVKEHARGQGVGERLLRHLIAEANRRGVCLCLNVRDNNPPDVATSEWGF